MEDQPSASKGTHPPIEETSTLPSSGLHHGRQQQFGWLRLSVLLTVASPHAKRVFLSADIEQAGFLHPLGVRHFCDAFSLRAENEFILRRWQPYSSTAVAAAKRWTGHQEQPVNQDASEADRRNVPDDVISAVLHSMEMTVAMRAALMTATHVMTLILSRRFRKK